jgi:lysozyme
MATINRRVLDLSHHNSITDYDAIKEAGIWGIIHKATESDYFVDDDYEPRRREFIERGFLWGAYHFLRPGNMIEQARFFIDTAGNDPSYLYCPDHEDDGVSLSDLKEFCREIERLTGRTGALYSGHVIKEQLSGRDDYLATWRLWLCHYSNTPSWPTSTWPQWYLWQYGDGTAGPPPQGCPGVTGGVDVNSWNGTDDELRSSWSGGGGVPIDPTVPVPTEVVLEQLTTQMRPDMVSALKPYNIKRNEPPPAEPYHGDS